MMTPVIPIFSSGDYDVQIRRGVETLREGGLIVLPTETVYGAAGLLTHPKARKRLRDLRGDSGKSAFTVHIAEPASAAAYLGTVSEFGQRLMRKLWPGPVGLVFDVPAERRRQVADQLGIPEADLYDEQGAITLRCPEHIVATDIISAAEAPVAITVPPSARDSAGSGEKLARELGGKVDLAFEAGPTSFSQSSTILKVKDDGYEMVREGVYDSRIIDKLLKTTILFVCSGNTCRSPMAEAIARHYLAEKQGVSEAELEKKGINVLSAGAFALPGARATPQAVDAVKDLGADLTSHRSRPLTIELIHQADTIYTMSKSHARAVTAMLPSASDKVMTLDPAGDIEDPIGGDLSLYQDLAGQLRTLVENRLRELK